MDITNDFLNIVQIYEKEMFKIKGNDEFSNFKSFYESVNLNPILYWIDNAFTCKSAKDDDIAKILREEGNKFYKDKKYKQALEKYTKSICYSAPDGEQLSLAFANRSAVLYALNDIKDCLSDIQYSLRSNYPAKLRHKIYLRQANCFLKLGKRENTIQTILKIRQCIREEKHGLRKQQLDTFLKEVGEIEKYAESPLNKALVTEIEYNVPKRPSLPKLKDGKNDNFLFASAAVSLKYNKSKGRHVIANRRIEVGDVIFVEKPFAFVPVFLEDSEIIYRNPRCYACFKQVKSSIPCKHCLTLFCSDECANSAWVQYHQWECPGSRNDMWTRLGICYIALRIMLLGAKTGFVEMISSSLEDDTKQYGDEHDNYKYIAKLVTNVNEIDLGLKVKNIIPALMLTLYLEEKTDFFNHLMSLPTINFKTKKECHMLVGGIIFRHLLQVVANASAIEDLEEGFTEKFRNCEPLTHDGYYARATGIYPTVSMMNHSCDENVALCFCDDYMIVKARSAINKGEEIFNSYGYECRNKPTEERKINLKGQYCFDCDCPACTPPTRPELYKIGALCPKCTGCATQIESGLRCSSCGHEFPCEHLLLLGNYRLQEEYDETNNINCLKESLVVNKQIFHKYSYFLYNIYQKIVNHYAADKDFMNWWRYVQITIDSSTAIMGKNSLTYAVLLRKYIFCAMDLLSSLSASERKRITKRDMFKAVEWINKLKNDMQKIYPLYYSPELLNFDKMEQQYQHIITIINN